MSLDRGHALRLLLGHRAMLLGYAASIVRDPHLAEDVFQDLSVLILEKCAEIPGAEAFPSWARKAARFEALNALRRSRRAPLALDGAALDALDAGWRRTDAIPDSARADALRGCLERLAPEARRLVDLRFRQGLPGDALAASTGRSVDAVYAALSRIYRTLANCVRGRLAQEGDSGA